ncbi:BrnA antitoxin family protein [Gellertiella hungarica]|uniref:Uncharacterized protein (DUF4415 family) n=1 Tax=Gellertiella hungarica TaxID=1572859 RepID=A0A7W6J6J2_9HYPH|nr:BrnA antitoxin family protein [Gellertiella hungarica]MBB4065674.1 uncharacterized protein (DUF4415 family) [Gellertiella hungarica]
MVKIYPTLKEFVPGRGYTKDDWDDVDSPELTEEELRSMRPAKEALPPEIYEALVEMQRQRGRPTVESPKKQVTLRLDADLVAHFKAGGKGWQSRMNAALRKAAGLDPA